MRSGVLLGLLIANVIFLVIGGAIFRALELPNEMVEREKIIQKFLDIGSYNFSTDDIRRIIDLVTTVGRATSLGQPIPQVDPANMTSWDPYEEDPPPYQWELTGSINFALTVVTTVGYGNRFPLTDEGQGFFIVYAFFGIPLMVVLLSNIGIKMAAFSKRVVQRLGQKCAKVDYILEFLALFIPGALLFMVLPSALMKYMEDWSYLEALYFSMSTLSTVGFGDYVAGGGLGVYGRLYGAFVIVWLFAGLSWFASLVSVMQGNPIETDKTDTAKPENNGGFTGDTVLADIPDGKHSYMVA